MQRRRRADPRTLILYALRMGREFRGTLLALAAMVLLGGALFRATALQSLGGQHPSFFVALYATWMAMFAQPGLTPETWYLELLCGVYPLFGFILIGEGIVRLGMLMIARKEGDKEW